jgi:hypothetical protein
MAARTVRRPSGSSVRNAVAWWIAFSSRETWRLTWALAVGGSVGEAEAAANLGERDVVGLAAGFSGEPVLGGGGVLGVFERLCGRGALEGAQAQELGKGVDDGGLGAEVDDLVGGRAAKPENSLEWGGGEANVRGSGAPSGAARRPSPSCACCGPLPGPTG